jgi:hypothetical protein
MIINYLEGALDYGIKECDFWNMTLAELDRAIASYNRVKKVEEQEKAMFDYILADLIGRSAARILNSNNEYPHISAVYPHLFEDTELKEKQAEQKAELSALRFKLFAESFNKNYKGAQKVNE